MPRRSPAGAVGLRPQDRHAQQYSFYNPKQHPMFDKDGGRIIFFEGTYTTTFSGNHDPTPLRLQPGDVPARPFRPAAGAAGGRLRGSDGARFGLT